METDRSVNELEAADYLDHAVQTLRNWRFQGCGPAYFKIGRRVVYRLSDLEAFLNKHRIEPESKS